MDRNYSLKEVLTAYLKHIRVTLVDLWSEEDRISVKVSWEGEESFISFRKEALEEEGFLKQLFFSIPSMLSYHYGKNIGQIFTLDEPNMHEIIIHYFEHMFPEKEFKK